MAVASSPVRAWEVSGDFRVNLYDGLWRDTRAGESIDVDASAMRFRLRLEQAVNDNCRFQTRFAATVLDEGNDWQFKIRSDRDSGTAVSPGTATLDEFFVQCASDDGRAEWRIGRFQSNLDLPHMPTRSLDRSQASSVNIGWTDGIAYRHGFSNRWFGEAVVQYNSFDGIGQAFRGPITFDDSDARIGFFGVLGSEAALGPIFMRTFSLTVYPDSLAPEGLGSDVREDYLLGALKLAAGWDLNEHGRRLVAVGELAHAINTPDKGALQLPGEGDAGAWGWQLGADIRNLVPRHSVGINYGRAEGGLLLSNDFRQNDELFELRWQYRPTADWVLELRGRWRRELERQIDASLLQRDRDFRLRATYQF